MGAAAGSGYLSIAWTAKKLAIRSGAQTILRSYARAAHTRKPLPVLAAHVETKKRLSQDYRDLERAKSNTSIVVDPSISSLESTLE